MDFRLDPVCGRMEKIQLEDEAWGGSTTAEVLCLLQTVSLLAFLENIGGLQTSLLFYHSKADRSNIWKFPKSFPEYPGSSCSITI